MSSILKALKKLEEEKNSLREERERDVSREILKPPAEKRITSGWFWLLAGTSGVIIVLLTVALFLKSKPGSQVVPADTFPHPAATDTPKESGLLPEKRAPEAVIPLQKKSGALPPPQPVAPVVQQKAAQPELPGFKAPDPPKAEATPVRNQTVPTETPLTLSGVAWNRDSADRLAILNGQPTAVGESVNGAHLLEILPDRVRLSRNGKTFELSIGKTSRTE